MAQCYGIPFLVGGEPPFFLSFSVFLYGTVAVYRDRDELRESSSMCLELDEVQFFISSCWILVFVLIQGV